MNGFLNPILELNSFKDMLSGIKENKTPILATGVIDSQKIHLGYTLQEKTNRPAVYITHSEIKAKEIYEDLQYFLGDKVKLYPSKDIIFYSADVHSIGITKKRFEVLDSIINNEKPTIVLSIEALFDKLTEKSIFKEHILHLEAGDEFKIDELSKKLIFMGYERCELVEGAGQFAIRGGIIDLFASNRDNAVRIEFWGDEIDSIRIIDSYSQRSVEKIDKISILPMRELVYTEKELGNAIKSIEKELEKTLKSFQKKGLHEECENLKSTFGLVLEKMREQKSFTGIDKFSKYFYDESYCLLDYLDDDSILYFDDPKRISTHTETVLYEFNESIKNRILKGYILSSSANMIFSYSEILSKTSKFATIIFMTLKQAVKDFKIKQIADFQIKSSGILQERLDLLIDDLKYYIKNNFRVLILAGATVRCERLYRELQENDINSIFVQSLEGYTLENSVVTISNGNLNKGFEYQDLKFVVITDKELFSKEKKVQKSRKKKGTKIENFTDLRVGDYIVHENHGIGVFKGIEKIITDGVSRDYLKIGYADGGHLYIHTSQMDMIQKYIGGEVSNVKLNKLGGAEWQKAKSKARASVQILAKELVDLYAKRQATKGYIYSNDNIWQKEFEDLFPFQETDDQLIAIEDVKKDMQDSKVMDRLICGDVGYGKTEIAIRAAFKAVQDSKQVAYLVPTTILAQQHYNTFVQRMKDFPIKVELLSRFRTKKQQESALIGLKSGMVDIVIGTHRILSKDIIFKDLGLVIVDEEQRFGVTHKEKLKHLKENIDVISLSATPIPRTLHMSLTGIRDMSVLEEPPQERQPIQTYVMEYNSEFVRDAINRELARSGQVYYLHNRVRNISEVAARIQELVPTANVAYAHGQMSERELENIMIDFIEGEINVLVCTTIIETGLDISNVNTIIIQDADCMGLSQLYQLRGRVGRSNRIAYAYLMYKKDKVLNEIAEKRLQTIKDFTEFGSGFKIAMRDLEIRGAGNLLGGEQHGHMDSVGYDMYCKLLDEAVKNLQGDIVEEVFETSIDISLSAFIPIKFIKNEEQKLEIYKKISFISNEQDFYDCQEEIEDRFGNIPKSVQNLLDIALLKAIAHSLGIISITQKQKNVIITFKEDLKIEASKVANLVLENKKRMMFTSSKNPYITYKCGEDDITTTLKNIKDILVFLKISLENEIV